MGQQLPDMLGITELFVGCPPIEVHGLLNVIFYTGVSMSFCFNKGVTC